MLRIRFLQISFYQVNVCIMNTDQICSLTIFFIMQLTRLSESRVKNFRNTKKHIKQRDTVKHYRGHIKFEGLIGFPRKNGRRYGRDAGWLQKEQIRHTNTAAK